jgi:single-strand selective monofunctional uracil DNA glycosylase
VSSPVARELEAAAKQLARRVQGLHFAAPVAHVYLPLRYAWEPHREYIRRFGASTKRVLYLGMNPGPFGMAQTGVPFGEIRAVREWLRIEGKVGRPSGEHPGRPVLGFACTRSEVSGARLWGAIADHYGEPERFFEHSYVANYCPLLFLEAGGRNRTPDVLPAAEREPLFEACDAHLRRVIRALEPRWVVGVGAFAQARASQVLGRGSPVRAGEPPRIAGVLHPSPASPRANRDWAGAVREQLRAAGVCGAAGG